MLIKRLLPYISLFLMIQTVLRCSLTLRSFTDIDLGILDVLKVMGLGIWFDAITAVFFIGPVVLYHLILPAAKHGSPLDKRIDTGMRFVYSFVLLFDSVAEHLFWTEFTTRFNFIAVDYLVYTQEVIGNIVESYPLHWLIAGIAITAWLITRFSLRVQPLAVSRGNVFTKRLSMAACFIAACFAAYHVSELDQSDILHNAEASELADNGIYNLFYAFFNNEISYSRFYATEPDKEVAAGARRLLEEEDAVFIHPEGHDLTRLIQHQGPELHKNVMIVSMESLGADYMASYGNTENLTPNLDRLAHEGLVFNKTYATGTRTVRGLEAMTLSIPPTPGQSIIRRPGNENLFSLGFIFKDRGYDTRFIYGGYGYFDNMNYFFSHNGFGIVDRTDMPKEKINFANVWGICDEDMFTRAIEEADKSYAAKKPFLHLIMTTSNHRPFTYPDGRIDLPSHSGRMGGVKYADYSVGKLLADASKKPWFKDTVFIFIADHTSGAGGKAELDAKKYHIPMIFYAPGFIKPQQFNNTASQIDMGPILLGMLNFSYYTKFYGEDLLNDKDEVPHAYISNYQKVAMVMDNDMVVLAPKRKVEQYSWPDVAVKEADDGDDANRVDEAIAFYQSASWWKDAYRKLPSTVVQQP